MRTAVGQPMHGVEVNSKVWGRDASLLAQSMERTASSPLWNPCLPFFPLVVAATASVALQATRPPFLCLHGAELGDGCQSLVYL